MSAFSARLQGQGLSARVIKSLSKVLCKELSSSHPTDLPQCRSLVERLPFPVIVPPSLASIDQLQGHKGVDPSAYTSFTLGNYTPSEQSQPSPYSLSHDQVLGHSLMFGRNRPHENAFITTLLRHVMDQGFGGTYFVANADTSIAKTIQGHAHSLGPSQASLVRVLNFLDTPGSQTHRFNPFSHIPATQMAELLLDALPPEVVAPLTNSQLAHQLMVQLLSCVCQYLVWGRDAGLWRLDLARVTQSLRFDSLQAAEEDARVPSYIQTSFSVFFRMMKIAFPGQTLAQAYAPFERVLVDGVLSPVSQDYAHVLATPPHNSDESAMVVSPGSMLTDRLMTVVLLPDLTHSPVAASFVGRLLSGAMATEVASRAYQFRVPDADKLNHLIVFQDAPLYLSASPAGVLMEFAASVGVGCLITALDYPQIKQQDGLSNELGSCQTKIFFKQPPVPTSGLPKPVAGDEREVPGDSLCQENIIFKSQLDEVSLDCIQPPLQSVSPLPGSDPLDTGKMARILYSRLSAHSTSTVPLSWCQETLARMLGFTHWHELSIHLSER